MNFVWQRNENNERKRFLSAMQRTAMESENNLLHEMVEVLRPLFGECQLTIMCNQDHTVVFTTQQGEDDLYWVGKMIRSIQSPEKDKLYHSYQKNYIWFRKEYPYIRTIPLTLMGQCNYTLVVESTKGKIASLGRDAVVLAMAVKLHILEKECRDNHYLEQITKLPNREAFVSDWNNQKKYSHMGLLCLRNRGEVIKRHGYACYSQMVEEMASFLITNWKDGLYCVGEGLMVLGLKGSDFSSVSQMQDYVDGMEKKITGAEFCGVVMSDVETPDPHHLLYMCECACEHAGAGVVVMLRNVAEMNAFYGKEERFVSG